MKTKCDISQYTPIYADKAKLTTKMHGYISLLVLSLAATCCGRFTFLRDLAQHEQNTIGQF